MRTFSDLKTGDLLVWGKAPIQRKALNYLDIVRVATTSNFGHVSVVWDEGPELSHVEAVKPVIVKRKIMKSNGLYVIQMGLNISDKEMVEFHRDKLGLKYGTLDAFRAWLGITLKDENKWQCAELCLEFYRSLGLDIPNAFTPTDLVTTVMDVTGKPLHKLKTEEF